MTRPASHLETEIKLAVKSVPAVKRLLARLGFTVTRPVVLESNFILDTPNGRIRGSGSMLRLRRAGRRSTVAFKGPPIESRYKTREEVESEISDPQAVLHILLRLGYA